eukprot:1159547-Pelagomonas_calceolata.AAC.6
MSCRTSTLPSSSTLCRASPMPSHTGKCSRVCSTRASGSELVGRVAHAPSIPHSEACTWENNRENFRTDATNELVVGSHCYRACSSSTLLSGQTCALSSCTSLPCQT